MSPGLKYHSLFLHHLDNEPNYCIFTTSYSHICKLKSEKTVSLELYVELRS